MLSITSNTVSFALTQNVWLRVLGGRAGRHALIIQTSDSSSIQVSNADMGNSSIGIVTSSIFSFPILEASKFGQLVTSEIWLMTFGVGVSVNVTETFRAGR